jgi:hypothetical protein
MKKRMVLLLIVGVACSATVRAANDRSGQPDASAEICKLLEGLPVGTPAEYERIPAIWRQAIAAGKRNGDDELRRLLDLSLPNGDESLADWQAVVIGGGVINGVSEVGEWPRRRLAELINDQPLLKKRWERTLELAAAMADNQRVRTGTRYDALRILGADDFQRRGEQIAKYLKPGVDDELQMGAVSGLSDVEAPEAAAHLIEASPRLNAENRGLAYEALVRTPERKVALQNAVGSARILREKLTAGQLAELTAMSGELNTLSDEERRDGWRLLFDGRSTDGWMTVKGQPLPARHVQEGSLNPHPCDYMLVFREPLESFVLSLDFKISPGCNSGVFVRTFSLEPRPGKDVGFNGIEVAIDDTQAAGFHDTGAIYDLVKPAENAMNPVGQWNRLVVTSHGTRLAVMLNDRRVSAMDFAEWREANKRPDGTPHKFDVAYAKHPRKGYIGLQDHGSDCWYRNMKVMPLP